MVKKYRTKIEITSQAANKDEAMEIVGDYLSGNITSGIDMEYTTTQVRFYDNSVAKALAVLLVISIGFLFSVKTTPEGRVQLGACQIAAVQPPLKTATADKNKLKFKKEWEEKQTREALNLIKQ